MKGFSLRPVPPFRLDMTVWVLRRVQANEMDRWDGHTYRRVLTVRDEPLEVSVVQTGPPDTPELLVTTEGPQSTATEADIAPVLTRMLGLDIDLAGFYRLAESDSHLAALVEPLMGFKPPRLGSIYEALVNGIACQQISLIVGIRLLNRLCSIYGLSVDDHYAFPRPEDMLRASVEDLRKLGFSGRKAEYILTISQAVATDQIDFASLEKLDDNTVEATLRGIYGVGRWTAQYVELRGMGRLNVYPADDVGNQTKLQHWLNLSERPNYECVHQIIDKWAPYRGLIYFLLLLDSQAREGLLAAQHMAPER